VQLGWPNATATLAYPGIYDQSVVDATTVGMAEHIGWDYMSVDLHTSVERYAYSQQKFSRLTWTTTWKRQPQYYLAKIVSCTMLLVWMCIWSV